MLVALADAIGYDARIGRRFLNAGVGFRRRVPAQGHPRVPGVRRRPRCRGVAGLPRRGRRHESPPARAGDPDRRGGRSDPGSPDVASRSSGWHSNRTLTTPGTRPAWMSLVDFWPSGRAWWPPILRRSRTRAGWPPDVEYVADARAAITGADAVLLLTEWREFRDLDPVAIAGLPASGRHGGRPECAGP